MKSRQDGFTLIEVLVAVMLIAIGILSVVGVLNMSRRLTLVAERQTTLTHQAQQELERVAALPYGQIALTTTPSHSTDASNPDFYVNGTNFQYDRTDSSKVEPLVVDPGGVLTPAGDGSTSTWSAGSLSGKVYTFVTWHYDSVCGTGTTALCSSSQDYKRVTVMVTLNHATHPSKPVMASTIVADPKAAPNGYTSGTTNPLRSPDSKCLDPSGAQISCTGFNNGTPVTYFLTDTPYSSSYQPPATGNNDHCTILALLGCPKTDQLITSVPTTGGTAPPCFSLDIGCLTGGGLDLPHPSTDAGSCGSPPSNNAKAHSWVAPAVPVGSTVNLTGAGGMTAYLQSASSVNVSAKLCLAVYIVPTGLLGSLTGSLLGTTQVGATVTADVQASAGVPTPVSFQFNLGSAAQLSSTVLNQVRIQLVVWLAASAGTDVALVYDHPQFASQVELITT